MIFLTERKYFDLSYAQFLRGLSVHPHRKILSSDMLLYLARTVWPFVIG